MPRSLRNYQPGSCIHLMQRGDNHADIFHDDDERLHYLGLLGQACVKYDCDLHAYVLMTNHVHFLVTIHQRNAQSLVMKDLAQFTAHWQHRRHGSSGTMWDGRYHASEIDSAPYLLMCQRYIELNPVRAGIVEFPGGYRWSSYRANAEGREDLLLTPHPVFAALGEGMARCAAYRALFDMPLAAKDLMRIRFAIQHEAALRRA
jgi:putative transposase